MEVPGNDTEFMDGFGSLPISDLIWLLTSAVKFKFGIFTVHRCADWWEVHHEKNGFQKNPKRPASNVIGDSYCFTLTEAIQFVKSK